VPDVPPREEREIVVEILNPDAIAILQFEIITLELKGHDYVCIREAIPEGGTFRAGNVLVDWQNCGRNMGSTIKATSVPVDTLSITVIVCVRHSRPTNGSIGLRSLEVTGLVRRED
tara:strand:- start:61 stop:408 length:348 start_codon:yes stop_codon:yes gene_type:complete